MDTRDLEYVLTIAKAGSFSKAAELLFVTQPALSQYVRRLGKNLRVKLFYRKQTHVELTPAGSHYVKKGAKILEEMKALENDMLHWENQVKNTLRIGISQFYGKWFLAYVLQAVKDKFPAYQLQIVDKESRNLESQILQGELDFAILPEPVFYEDISFLPLVQEEILFGISMDNKEALALVPYAMKAGKLNLLPFQHYSFVLPREGMKIHLAALNICRKAGFLPQSVYQSENLDTVYSLINHNYGVGFLPDMMVKHLDATVNRVRFYSVKSQNNHRMIGLAYQKDSLVQDLASRLAAAIKEQNIK